MLIPTFCCFALGKSSSLSWCGSVSRAALTHPGQGQEHLPLGSPEPRGLFLLLLETGQGPEARFLTWGFTRGSAEAVASFLDPPVEQVVLCTSSSPWPPSSELWLPQWLFSSDALGHPQTVVPSKGHWRGCSDLGMSKRDARPEF